MAVPSSAQKSFASPQVSSTASSPPRYKVLLKKAGWLAGFGIHPFVLLGSVWVLLVATSALTFNGLISPGELKEEPQRPPIPTDTLQSGGVLRMPSDSDQTVIQSKQPQMVEPDETAVQTTNAMGSRGQTDKLSKEGQPAVPGWSMVLLIGSCAGGCILISNQFNHPPKPRKGLIKGSRRKGPKPPQTAPKPALQSEQKAPLTPPAPTGTPAAFAASRATNAPIRPAPNSVRSPQPQFVGLRSAVIAGSPSFPDSQDPGQDNVPSEITPTVAAPSQTQSQSRSTDGNLADQLDLRNQQSLSSLI